MNAAHEHVLKMKVAVTSYDDAAARIIKASGEKTGRYVCVANVHMERQWGRSEAMGTRQWGRS